MAENLKYYMKRLVRFVRAILLGALLTPLNQSGWESRMLLVNLGAIGDIVVFTSVLKHYKRAFPGKKIFLLLSGTSGVKPALIKTYVDEIIFISPKKYNTNPRYGYGVVKQLRTIGFATVIEHNPHLEFAGKLIATELDAKRVICYEGVRIEIEKPILASYAKGFAYIRNKIFPRYTDVIPNTIEQWRKSPTAEFVPHVIHHHVKIFEYASGTTQAEYAPELIAEGRALPAELKKNGYCLLSLAAGAPCKEWEMKKFAAICDYLTAKKIPLVIIGTKNDAKRKKDFSKFLTLAKLAPTSIIDLTGVTDIIDVVSLAKNCLFTLSNETSIPHIAIALQKPCMVVAAAWNLGMWTFYGYEDINKWVYQKNAPCMGDNGQCITDQNLTAPCLSAVKPKEVEVKLDELLDYIHSQKKYPQKPFTMDFGE